MFTDNFCTSPSLAKILLTHESYLCGTIKNNRKNYCKAIKDVALQKGQAPFFKGKFKTCEVDPDKEDNDDDIPTQKLLACKFRARQSKKKSQT